MEVHHHKHSQNPSAGHAGKKFKHYFFEFFMLFLAVFCGFLAENFREHYVERHREKEYIKSLLDDLKTDTAQFNFGLNKIPLTYPFLDSSYLNIRKIEQYNYIVLGRWSRPANGPIFDYTPALSIIEQLKSSGNLRLIESHPVVKKSIEYETYVRNYLQLVHGEVLKARFKIFEIEDEICNYDKFILYLDKNKNPFIKTISDSTFSLYDIPVVIKDPAKLNLLANSFVNLKGWNTAYARSIDSTKIIATQLINLINSEYKIK